MKPNQYLDHVKIRSPKIKRDFLQHATDWCNCKACPLGSTATHHVLCRGKLPCDVLFIGEAPGEVEDTLGQPFVGPSGKLLTKIIEEVGRSVKFTFAIANTLACVPWNEDQTGVRPPTGPELTQCQSRLWELLPMANPLAIVYVGKVSGDRAKVITGEYKPVPSLLIYHPAYLLRKGGASPNNLDYKRTVLNLKQFLTSLQSGKK